MQEIHCKGAMCPWPITGRLQECAFLAPCKYLGYAPELALNIVGGRYIVGVELGESLYIEVGIVWS